MEPEIITQKKPHDYINMIFRRKWFIVLPIIIGIIAGATLANILPKAYQSSTLILVEEGRVINPLIQGLAVSTSVAQRLAILREQILGWDRINQLISKLHLAKNVKTQVEFEELVKKLRKDIRVKLRGRNIIGISYQNMNPKIAMNTVRTITDIFIAENLRQQTMETENAISFINDQLGLYQKKLKQVEVSGMEKDLKNLLIDSTEKHPVVIELRKTIAKSQEEIDSGNYAVDPSTIAGSDEELLALKQEIKQLKDEVSASMASTQDSGENRTRLASSTNEQLYKLLLLEKTEKVTMRDLGVNQGLYNELLKRLETAKITQRLEASKEGTRYTILDPARLPLKPIKPNKVLVLFTGIFLGLCTGLGLVLGVEVFDRSFVNLDEAREHIDVPVLGGVSKIVTRADVRMQKIRNIKIAGVSAITGVSLLVVIIFNIVLGGR